MPIIRSLDPNKQGYGWYGDAFANVVSWFKYGTIPQPAIPRPVAPSSVEEMVVLGQWTPEQATEGIWKQQGQETIDAINKAIAEGSYTPTGESWLAKWWWLLAVGGVGLVLIGRRK